MEREARRAALLVADDALDVIVETLKGRGVRHRYVRNFVLSRCNPLTRAGKTVPEFDEAIAKVRKALERFEPGCVRLEHMARAVMYGAPVSEGEDAG